MTSADAGPEDATLSRWWGRQAAEAQLRRAPGVGMSRDAIEALIDEMGDHVHALATADPTHKAEVYAYRGPRLTYQPTQRTVRAAAPPRPRPPWAIGSCPRDDWTRTHIPPVLRGTLGL